MSSSVLKNTYFSSINIYFEYLIGLIISIIIARTLGPDQFGAYSYLVKVTGILIILTNAGINTGAIKFIAEARAQHNQTQIKAIYAYFHKIQMIKTGVITLVFSVLVYFFPDVTIGGNDRYLAAFVVFAVVFKSAHMYRVGVFKGFERFDFLAFTVLVVAPLNLLLVFCVKYFDAQLLNFYMLFTAITALYWFISGFYLRKLNLKPTKETAELSESLKQRMAHHLKIVSINTIVGGLAIGQCEVLLLNYFATNEAISYFYIAITIAGAALLLVPGVYSAVLFPVIAKAIADVKQNPAVKIKQSSQYLFILGLMVATPTVYYGESIVVFLYGEAFSQAGLILGIFTLVGAFNAFKEPVNAYLLSIDKQSMMLKLSAFTLVLSISLNTVLISHWGLKGAVIAYTAVSLILTIIMMFIAYYYLKITPNFKKLIIIAFSAVLAMYLASTVSDLLTGIFEILVGFIVFGVLYLFCLIMLNALNGSDYSIMVKYSTKLGQKPSKILQGFISARLKI